ncbi:MAG TPA: helix-turn-helix domain-containing protein [Noviherbaspirillum sp.]|nr:helix-turn-helix domain-containing protein [Noviherbaspirillum sp.]
MATRTAKKETLLTQKELAARWQISERWVEKLRQTGKGPAFVALGESPKLKTIRYRIADVEAYETSRQTKGGE